MDGPVKFFISYAREDAEFVLRLARDLRAAGVPVWLDQLDIAGGQRWDLAVEQALRSARVMIVVLSPDAFASHNVMDEVSYALEEHKLVVPVTIRECDVPFRLRRVQRIDFSADYDMGLQGLYAALGVNDRPIAGVVTSSVPAQGADAAAPAQPASDPASPNGAAPQPWQTDLVEVAETFAFMDKRKSSLLLRFVLQTLTQKQWQDERVAQVEFCVTEVLENAFRHGVGADRSGRVSVKASLTSDWCDIRVSDTGPGFDLGARLRSQMQDGDVDSYRGLAQAAGLADLRQADRNTIWLQFNRQRPKAQILRLGEIYVVQCVGRMDHDSSGDFHVALVGHEWEAGARVAVDLTLVEYIASVGFRTLMVFAKTVRALAGKTVLIGPSPLVVEQLEISRFNQVFPVVVRTRSEALARLGESSA